MYHCALKGQFTQILKGTLILALVVSINADIFFFMCLGLIRTISAYADDKQPQFKVTAISATIGKSHG